MGAGCYANDPAGGSATSCSVSPVLGGAVGVARGYRCGTGGPVEQSTAAQAQSALFGPPAPRSGVETAVDQKAGQAAPSIRSTVGDPATQTVAKGDVTRDIVAAPEGDGREAQTAVGGN